MQNGDLALPSNFCFVAKPSIVTVLHSIITCVSIMLTCIRTHFRTEPMSEKLC